MTTIPTVGIYLTEDERRHLTNLCNELEVSRERARRRNEIAKEQAIEATQATLYKLMHLPASAAAEHANRGPGGPFQRTVTCAWCDNRYVSAIPLDIDKGTCGCNCACDVRLRDGNWDIFCGYGSESDMDVLRFVANPPSAPADPICDECIRERMLCGDIVKIDQLDPGEALMAMLDAAKDDSQ